MSFLFEIQTKKTKIENTAKKKISMDVRRPEGISQSSFRAPNKFSFSASPSIKTPSYQPGRGMDGVKMTPQLPDFESPYAKRVFEMSQFHQTKKAKPSFQFSFYNFKAFFTTLQDHIHFSIPRLTPNKLVYGSIMSGVAFGMVSLGVIEKTFESNANASDAESVKVEAVHLETENYNPEKDVFMQYFSDAADADYQSNVRELVKGHPIEEMLPYIFEKDRVTAAFLIGIAKKESNWGKRRPVLDGQDCFNYWGYRGQRRLMGSGGHTCFNSRKDAVDTVAKRLETLINSERLNTPAKLIVWKCGMSCEGHGRESVEKWISDVDAYYSEMMALESENTEIENIEEEGG